MPIQRSASRRHHRSHTESAMKRLVAWVLSLSLMLSGPVSPIAMAQATDQLRQEVLDGFDRVAALLDDAGSDIDPTWADVDELSFELAFEDPETIGAWVRDEIRFEAYPGLLRGAEGTLAARAGNALDQATLLARLLSDAGYEVEVALSELDATMAERLVEDMASEVRSRPSQGSFEAARSGGVEAAVTTFGAEAARLEEIRERGASRLDELAADVEHAAAELTALVHDAGLELGGGDPRAALVEEARDYFFVRWRLSPADPWQSAHPAFAEPLVDLGDLDVAEVFADSIPESWQHRVRIQMFVEQKLGNELQARPVTEAWERPAANLTGVPLRFASRADGYLDVDDPTDLDAVRDATRFFLPTMADSLAPGGVAFDLGGNVVPPDAAASAAAGVFQEVGGAVGRAAGALDAIGGESESDPDEFIALSAHWIEYTLIAPGGAETVHRRMILDRVGAEARAAGESGLLPMDEAEVFAELQTSFVVMVATGGFSQNYLAWHGLEQNRIAQSYLRDSAGAVLAGEPRPDVSSEMAQAEAKLGYLLYHGLLDSFTPDGRLRYRSAPTLSVLGRSLDGDTARTDIVAHEERVITGDGVPDAAARLRVGVWQTRAEGLPFEQESVEIQNAFTALDAARSEGIGIVVLAPGDFGDVDALDLPGDSRAAIREDLARGYAVLTPTQVPVSATEPGWWRIDLATGQTLGRGGDGRGQSFVEYLTSFEVSISITAGFAVFGASQCMDKPPTEAGCCLLENMAYAALGVGVGVYLGFTMAALSVFYIMDVGFNLAGAFGMLPSLCSMVAKREPWDLRIAVA